MGCTGSSQMVKFLAFAVGNLFLGAEGSRGRLGNGSGGGYPGYRAYA